ncbi:MAG TPA: hypothetical protein PKY54_10450 [Chitinophagales bacterium]|nr:hypothetical protein [Chitinophagales bacterium]HMW12709.1 hypothetical protein [Chitinophagales bacterium]HMX61385.1 hypothetical protein [Chitinophagales bacterium]HMZ34022.1 hypothetical protein [Chitinophagales bacterium]HNA39739.1 hypothetical protein [Chitinophagales bacterium]
MQTIKIEINNDAVLKLIEELETNKFIKIVKDKKKPMSSRKLSSLLLGSINNKEAAKMKAELKNMRKEWERTI